MSEARLDFQKRARQQTFGCNERAREHQLSHHQYRVFSAVLNGLGAVSGALAGGTLLSAAETGTWWAYAAGALGAIGAAAIALDAQLGLKGQAEAHRLAAIRFGALRTSYYDIRLLSLNEEEGVAKVDELTERKAEVEETSPLVEPRARKKRAKQKIEEERRKERSEREEMARKAGAL